MKIAHEAPLDLFEVVQAYTDYDYALVHLFEKSEQYFEYFQKARMNGREVILDNSIFELGTAFDGERYAYWINKLKPTWYIVPDVLQDTVGTVEKFINFVSLPTVRELHNSRHSGHAIGKIGVVQGKTYEDLRACYEFMSEVADYIAISFDYDYYLTTGTTKNIRVDEDSQKLALYATGRYKLIRSLIDDGVWNFNKPHHLLGCSLAQEMAWYRPLKNITSVDTSNPIMAAIKNAKYLPNIGLTWKPKDKLADYMFESFADGDVEALAIGNMLSFADIANG